MDYASQIGSYRRGSVSTDDANFYSKSITGQLCGDIFPLPPAWSVEDSTTRSTARIYSAGIILDEMPSKEQCESLIWTYLKGYHTISPLFHGPSFLRQAHRYIERYLRIFAKDSQVDHLVSNILTYSRVDTSSTDVDLHFLALLTAVLFAGCAISSRKQLGEVFGGRSRENLSSRFYRRAVRAIRLTNFPETPSLSTLSAFIIVNTLWMREEQSLTCCSFVGLAIRVAQMLGKQESFFKSKDVQAAACRIVSNTGYS
jgi:hypothetical protein